MCSCITVFRTVDHGAGVEAAVLLAPVGGDAGALGEVAHRRRLHVDDLHAGRIKNFGFHDTQHTSGRRGEKRREGEERRGEAGGGVDSQPPAAAAPGSRCAAGCLVPPPPPRCICTEERQQQQQQRHKTIIHRAMSQACLVFSDTPG